MVAGEAAHTLYRRDTNSVKKEPGSTFAFMAASSSCCWYASTSRWLTRVAEVLAVPGLLAIAPAAAAVAAVRGEGETEVVEGAAALSAVAALLGSGLETVLEGSARALLEPPAALVEYSCTKTPSKLKLMWCYATVVHSHSMTWLRCTSNEMLGQDLQQYFEYVQVSVVLSPCCELRHQKQLPYRLKVTMSPDPCAKQGMTD